jgi:hypothetical protein
MILFFLLLKIPKNNFLGRLEANTYIHESHILILIIKKRAMIDIM